jgi:hypothetical protein
METKEDFGQLRLRFTDSIQHDYELIRPIVLFTQPVADRSRETDVERILSVVMTLRIQDRDVFGYLVAARKAAVRGLAAPDSFQPRER